MAKNYVEDGNKELVEVRFVWFDVPWYMLCCVTRVAGAGLPKEQVPFHPSAPSAY
jgi:hypothetical protein